MFKIAMVSLLKMLKDKKAIIGIIIAPVIIMFMLSFMGNGTPSDITIGLMDYNKSDMSEFLISQLEKDTTIHVRQMSEEEINENLEKQNISVGIVIPKDFNNQVNILKTDENAYYVLKNKVNNILKELILIGNVPEIQKINHVKYINHYKSSNKTFIIGFLINFMMYSMIYIITELMDLKKNNILKRCYTTPHNSFQLLGGIMIAMFFLVLIQFVAINIMSLILFKELLFTNIIGALIIFVPFIFAILGLGLLISRVWKNPDLIPVVANLIIIPTGMVSGTFMPKEMLPDFLTKFAFLAPQHWVANGLQNINESLTTALPSIVILILLALCLLTASSYNFSNLLKD